MKVNATRPIETYEPSGAEVRIHWDITSDERENPDGSVIIEYFAQCAVCQAMARRSELIESIIGEVYTTGREFAVINNRDVDPEQYQQYQDFRSKAKELADGWIAIRDNK